VCALIAVRHGEIAVACPFPSRAVESPALFLFFFFLSPCTLDFAAATAELFGKKNRRHHNNLLSIIGVPENYL